MAAALAGAACEPTTAVVPTSYVAILTQLDRPASGLNVRFAYRVAELSGTLGFDTTIVVPATDTVIVPVPPATYAVRLDSLPSTCTARRGTEQYVVVPAAPSTAIARYFIDCRAALTVETLGEGAYLDTTLIWHLTGPGSSRSGVIGASDTLTFDHLDPGTYTVSLSHVAGHCVVTNSGGPDQVVAVTSAGDARVQFRVACSDPAKRPQLLSFAATHSGGMAAFVFRAADPDHDIERYWFDVTDCRRNSLQPGGARLRRGLSSGRTARLDTVTVVGAVETGLPDSLVSGACGALRVADEYGNTTVVLEQPLAPAPGSAPAATVFNATLIGTSALRTQLGVLDPDGDFAGVFGSLLVRDGVLQPADGRSDVALFNIPGYLVPQLPDVALGGLLAWSDIYAVTVYLIDVRGHFTRLVDTEVFR